MAVAICKYLPHKGHRRALTILSAADIINEHGGSFMSKIEEETEIADAPSIDGVPSVNEEQPANDVNDANNAPTANDAPSVTEENDGETAVTDALAVENVPELMVEALSAEHNAQRLSEAIRLPKRVAVYLVAAVYFVVGVLCVSITSYITVVLPYIVGAMLVLVGAVGFVFSLVHRDYKSVKTNKTATFLLALGLGILIIFEEFDPKSDPIMLISIIWGVFGLFEGAHAFNHAITRIANSERCVYYIIKGIAECVVAFMMLYRPESHEAHFFHIVVFGISLIIDAVTMIPKIKQFLSKF